MKRGLHVEPPVLPPRSPATVAVIGVTGGIATGKSLVTQLLQAKGATVFSADEAARAVLSPHSPLLEAIARAFGGDMLLPDGSLDRARLGQRIFQDAQARAQLNSLLHPPILRLLRAQIESARRDLSSGAVIAVEVPLLYETNLQRWFDRVVVVSAPEALQIARLCAREGIDSEEARQRLKSQWPLTAKVARADYVITNDGSLADLAMAVDRLWKALQSGR